VAQVKRAGPGIDILLKGLNFDGFKEKVCSYKLFNERDFHMSLVVVYENYVTFCKRIGVQPASFETWRALAGR
jgi:hypothetical protein